MVRAFTGKGLALLLVLVLAWGVARGQTRSPTHTGSLRPGTTTYEMHDSSQVVAAEADTSLGYISMGGVDVLGVKVHYKSLNDTDSINCIIYMDISDGDDDWVQWGGLDTMVVSGANDTTVVKRVPNHPDYAGKARTRIQGAAVAGDTVNVVVRLITVVASDSRL